MKKIIIGIIMVSVLFLGLSGHSFAIERDYGTAGCGLGSLLLGDEPGMVQILVATLNGIAGNQTFGITSGTLNCEKQAQFSSNERLNQFVVANLDSIAKDIAYGYGESLDTLSELLNIPIEKRIEIYSKLQSNFSNIFVSEDIEATSVIDSIISIING